MTNLARVRWPSVLLWGFCLFLATLSGVEGLSADLKFRAQLIWATDEEKPKDKPKIKELDPKLRDKLRNCKVFRWKNFYEIDQENFKVADKGSKITSVSRKCVIEVTHLGGCVIEVKLYGEGTLVSTVRHSLPKGEYLIISGDVKDKTTDAWLVALSQVDQ